MKAVIFDKDGVVIDSEATNIKAAIKAFKELKIELKEEEKEWIIGRHPDDYNKLFQNKYDFSYEKFRELQRKFYYELLDSTPLFDEAISLIKKLKRLGVPLALTTSSSLKSTISTFEKADLKNTFDIIVTFEDYAKRKPNPESYLITAKKLEINPSKCVVIEDSKVGVEAAKNAGMKCIAIPNEYTRNQDLSKADLIVESAKKINIKLLNNL